MDERRDGGAAGHDAAALFEAGLAADAAPAVAEMAAHFPQLELLEVLGQGGMGVVYRARQKSLDRIVALKVLAPPPGDAHDFAERFQREARALARLEHPHIVRVYEHGSTDGLHWLVMEYVDGITLREALRAGRIPPEQALRIVPQICDALQAAHDHGIVHRDIKPENVLLAKDGNVKIADFGLARIVEQDDTRLTRRDQIMGTLHYMAPEQFESPGDVDHRADIYSLGVVLYEMLTGELPIGRFETPSERAAVDARLDEVVLRALEKSRERRYQKADELRSDVDVVAAGGVLPPRRPGTPRRDGPSVRSVLAICAFAATPLGLLALIAAATIAEVHEAELGRVGYQEVWLVGTIAASVAGAFGVLGGAVAWIRIALSRGRLLGLRPAVAGTLLPLLLAPVVGPAGIMLENAMRPPYPGSATVAVAAAPRTRFAPGSDDVRVYYGPTDPVLRDGVADAATNLFRRGRAHALAAATDPLDAECVALYGADAVAAMRALSQDDLARSRVERALGLALLEPGELRSDMRTWSVKKVLLSEDGSTAQVQCESTSAYVSFPIRRVDPAAEPTPAEAADDADPAHGIGAWRLVAGPVTENPRWTSRTLDGTYVTGLPAWGGTERSLAELRKVVESALTHAIAGRGLDGAETLYTADARASLVGYTSEELAALGQERRLGLALVARDAVGTPLGDFTRIASVAFDDPGLRADVKLTDGSRELGVRCAMEGHAWRLLAEPVTVEPVATGGRKTR